MKEQVEGAEAEVESESDVVIGITEDSGVILLSSDSEKSAEPKVKAEIVPDEQIVEESVTDETQFTLDIPSMFPTSAETSVTFTLPAALSSTIASTVQQVTSGIPRFTPPVVPRSVSYTHLTLPTKRIV